MFLSFTQLLTVRRYMYCEIVLNKFNELVFTATMQLRRGVPSTEQNTSATSRAVNNLKNLFFLRVYYFWT